MVIKLPKLDRRYTMRTIQIGLERATEIIKDIDIPTLPLYLTMIQKELSKAQPSFQIIEKYVSQDMALTAKLLKTVNSLAFKTQSHISNLLQALTILGQDKFYEYVLSESLRKALDNHALSSDNFAILWHNSTQTAKACKFMAEKISKSIDTDLHIDSNHAYLAGLFHDCGIPILASRFPNYEVEMMNSFAHGEPLVDMENRLFDSDHSIICFLIAKMWNLPVSVQFAIIGHHTIDIGYAGDKEYRELAVILRACRSFIHAIGRKNHPILEETFDMITAIELLVSELKLDEEFVQELFNSMRVEFEM